MGLKKYNIIGRLVAGLFYLVPVLLNAQTSVKDTIESDTWTKAGSPYRVIGNITVQNLTIEAGVQVQFQGNYQFNVSGRLTAVGSKADSIIFTGGRGLLFDTLSSNSTLAYCIFENAISYGIRFEKSISRFEKCRITNSDANGIEIAGCNLYLFKCRITDNPGYGVLVNSNGKAVFSNCMIRGNTSRGIYTDTGKIEINNSLICSNNQGGIRLSTANDTLVLRNTNVVYNTSGPGIVSFNGSIDIRNSIIYFNDSGIGYSGSSVRIYYNDIQEWDNSNNNIYDNPLFENVMDFCLSATSPCIDRGDPNSIYYDRYFPPSKGGSRNDLGMYGGPQGGMWFEPLYITPAVLNFGNTTVGDSSLLTVTIKNYADSNLSINQLSITGADAASFEVDIAAPLEIVRFDSIQTEIKFLPQERKLFADASLVITAGKEFQEIPLTGNGVVPDISVNPDSMNFQSVDVNDSSLKYFEISNEGQGILKINSITSSHPVFIPLYKTLPWSINAFQKDTLQVLFKPDSCQIYLENITLFTNDPNPEEAQFQVRVAGTGLAPVLTPSADSINFSAVMLNQDSTITVILQNTGNDTMQIFSKNISGTDSLSFQITSGQGGITLLPAARDTVRILFQPTVARLYTALLRTASNDPFINPHYIVLQGRGVIPLLSLSSAVLNFGQVQVDADSVETLIITNNGSAALKVRNILILPDSSAFSIIDGDENFDVPAGGFADSIKVSFLPRIAGSTSALLQMLTNDPAYDTLQISLSGRGVNFEIAVTPDDSLDFHRVAVGRDSILNLLLENLGSGDLLVKAHITGPDSLHFKLGNGDSSLVIPENSPQHMLQVVFAPLSRGKKSAALEIFSNDADHPAILISLNGYALAAEIHTVMTTINFNPTYVWENRTQSVGIFNLGEIGLIIDSLRINGIDSNEFLLPGLTLPLIVPAGTDSQAVQIEFTPAGPGQKNDTLFFYSNAPSSPAHLNLSGTAVLDPTPAVLTVDTSSLDFTAGNNQTVYTVVKDNECIIQTVALFIKPGGESIYQQVNFSRSNDSLWNVIIPAEHISVRGIEYYLEARHGGIITTYPQNGAAGPEIGIVRAALLNFPAATLNGDYQMISLPVRTGNQKLSDLFQDDLGEYNNANYRFFDWSSDSAEYTELSALDTPLPPGKALWLITREATLLDVENAESNLDTMDYALPLTPGWNMIADPFAFPVSWEQIDNSFVQGNTLWYYDGDGWIIDSTLIPYRGYAVQVGEDTALHIPPRQTAKQSLPRTAQSVEWNLQIMASNGFHHDFCNYAGTRISAEDGWDICDISEPPGIGTYVSAYFQTDTIAGISRRLAGDFRTPDQQQYIFNLTLYNNSPGKTTVQVIPHNLPENLDWVVLSAHGKLRYPRDKWTSENLQQESYRLIIGTRTVLQPFLDEYKEIPATFRLAQNFPNPFNPVTTVAYQLPEAVDISIDIFDILGKKVRTLLPETRQEAGYYQLRWDGRNDRQQAVASAVYILFLHSGKYQQAMKMILQR